MTEWVLKIDATGGVELTIGPKPRRTVALSPEEGRALAVAVLRTIDLADELSGAKETGAHEKEETP